MRIVDSLIRPMTPADVDAVLAVERECYPQPWTAEFFLQELDSPFASIEILWVGEKVAGYLCCWYLEGELHILNLATAPGFPPARGRRNPAAQSDRNCPRAQGCQGFS